MTPGDGVSGSLSEYSENGPLSPSPWVILRNKEKARGNGVESQFRKPNTTPSRGQESI